MPADLSDIDHNQWTGKDILDNFQKELQIVYLIAFSHMWTHKLWHSPNAVKKHLNFRCLTQKPVNPCQGWDYTMGHVCIGRYFVVFTPNLSLFALWCTSAKQPCSSSLICLFATYPILCSSGEKHLVNGEYWPIVPLWLPPLAGDSSCIWG